eukprot:2776098-Rhodomonas_salina.2
MPNKYTGIASKRDADIFSSGELSGCHQACKPLLNLALSFLCDVHCLPLHMQTEALAMQLGTGRVHGVGINSEQMQRALATPVIMRPALKFPASSKKFAKWSKLYTARLKKKFSPVSTVLMMEKFSLSHQTLDGSASLPQPHFFQATLSFRTLNSCSKTGRKVRHPLFLFLSEHLHCRGNLRLWDEHYCSVAPESHVLCMGLSSSAYSSSLPQSASRPVPCSQDTVTEAAVEDNTGCAGGQQ